MDDVYEAGGDRRQLNEMLRLRDQTAVTVEQWRDIIGRDDLLSSLERTADGRLTPDAVEELADLVERWRGIWAQPHKSDGGPSVSMPPRVAPAINWNDPDILSQRAGLPPWAQPLTWRQWALTQVAYHTASRDPEVLAFRRSVADRPGDSTADATAATTEPPLQDVDGHEVERWVEAQRRQEPTVPVDAPRLLIAVREGLLLKEMRAVPVVPGGRLDQLRQLAERLAATWRWHPASALDFLLLDRVPWVEVISVEILPPVSASAGPRQAHSWGAFGRIVLTIDPHLEPTDVTRVYRIVRRQLVVRRERALEEKTLRLAAFVAGRPRDEALSDQMQGWNTTYQEHPTWRYTDVRRFGRDRLRARARLLAYDWRYPSALVQITQRSGSGSGGRSTGEQA